MNSDPLLQKCVDVAAQTLQQGEAVVRIRLAEPSLSRPDYLTRYKVDIAKKNPSGTQITAKRCIVVEISSNTGVATVDPEATCDAISDINGL